MRNKGINPYNPEVSKFGHYVYMVCRSVWVNYRNKYGRHRKVLTSFVGKSAIGEEYGDIDPASAEIEGTDYSGLIDLNMILEGVDPDDRKILVSLAEGQSKAVVVDQGFSRARIKTAVDRVRMILTP